MATYTPIQSIVLTSGSTTINFNNIPQNYTDLVLVINGTAAGADSLKVQYNGDTATNYSYTILYGTGSATGSLGSANNSLLQIGTISTNQITTIIQIQNYSNTTTYKTNISRSNDSSSQVNSSVGLWRSTAAINSIKIATTGNNFLTGSTFDLYGIGVAAMTNPFAAGGTSISYDSSYVYHTFTASGTFTPLNNMTADLLVVAGGGAGGGSYSGAGGGAGGLVGLSSQSLTAGTSYAVVVGAGGGGNSVSYNGANGNNGSNSQFGALTAAVGGGGGGASGNSNSLPGSAGGSGGGSASGTSGGGAGTSGQGYAGVYGGGGGAGGLGNIGSYTPSSAGGIGATYNTSVGTGTSTGPFAFIDAMGAATSTGEFSSGHYYYAGGGGAAAFVAGGNSGLGGGGSGAITGTSLGFAGKTNTGGGGGGGASSSGTSGTGAGAQGGSGIIIVRYPR